MIIHKLFMRKIKYLGMNNRKIYFNLIESKFSILVIKLAFILN